MVQVTIILPPRKYQLFGALHWRFIAGVGNLLPASKLSLSMLQHNAASDAKLHDKQARSDSRVS